MKNVVKKILIPFMVVFIALLGTVTVFAETSTAPAILKIQGLDDREIISYSYSFDQETDKDGKISGEPGMQKFVVKVKPLNNDQLHKFMLDSNITKNVNIVVNNKVNGSVAKEFKLEDAKCVDYKMKYSTDLGNYEEIKLTAKVFSDGPVSFKNPNKASTGIGTTISNDSNIVQIVVISIGAAIILAGVVVLVIVSKKKKKAE